VSSPRAIIPTPSRRCSQLSASLRRLDRASLTLAGMSGRLTGPAEPALQEAAEADRSLRELATRVASVERALNLAPRGPLAQVHAALTAQLEDGVAAYERLVVAAAGYVAEDARPTTEHPAAGRLTEATDLLQGVAAALAELRTAGTPLRTP
ncbi:phage shock envelope stress response protein PspM, partial [Micromonospora sp. NPDC003776]